MIQPTKDDLRTWLSEARIQLQDERSARQRAEYRLQVATRKLGELVLERKIEVPVQKLGELVIRQIIEDEAEQERQCNAAKQLVQA